METYNGVGWTIDRWLNRSTNLIVKIIKGENLLLDNSNGDIPGYLRQYFSDNYILKGKKYVLSILIDEVSGTPNQYGYYGYISEALENGSLSSKGISKADLHSLQSTLSSNMTGVQIQVEAGCTMKIQAIKLELGTQQTLVNNEKELIEIPNYADELNRCRRAVQTQSIDSFSNDADYTLYNDAFAMTAMQKKYIEQIVKVAKSYYMADAQFYHNAISNVENGLGNKYTHDRDATTGDYLGEAGPSRYHIFEYGTTGSPLYSTYFGIDTVENNCRYRDIIDCSNYVGFILRGLSYEDSPYSMVPYRWRSTSTWDANRRQQLVSEKYPWAVNPFNWRMYRYPEKPEQNFNEFNDDAYYYLSMPRGAAQLLSWLISQGCLIKYRGDLANVDVGDIIFYASTEEEGYKGVSHIAFCATKEIAADNEDFNGYPFKHQIYHSTIKTPVANDELFEHYDANHPRTFFYTYTTDSNGNVTDIESTDYLELYNPRRIIAICRPALLLRDKMNTTNSVIAPNVLDNGYFDSSHLIDQKQQYFVPVGVPYYSNGSLSSLVGTTTAQQPSAQLVVSGTAYRFTNSSGTNYYVATDNVIRGYCKNGYSIDRWQIYNGGDVIIQNEGIKVEGVAKSGYLQFGQKIENFENYIGATMTLSILVKEITGDIGCICRWSSDTSVKRQEEIVITKPGFYTRTFNIPSYADQLQVLFTTRSDSPSILVQAIKLEVGDSQTLINQYNDELNTYIINSYDNNIELYKCQCHYQLFTSYKTDQDVMDFRPSLRDTGPTFGEIEINGTTYYYADANL